MIFYSIPALIYRTNLIDKAFTICKFSYYILKVNGMNKSNHFTASSVVSLAKKKEKKKTREKNKCIAYIRFGEIKSKSKRRKKVFFRTEKEWRKAIDNYILELIIFLAPLCTVIFILEVLYYFFLI